MTRCASRRGKDRSIIVAAKASNAIGGYRIVGMLVYRGVMKPGVREGWQITGIIVLETLANGTYGSLTQQMANPVGKG